MVQGNRLRDEKSPYLRLHGDNPVDWFPWGEEAFLQAKILDKPVFLSIGYSTCHWCHVMARESFENPRIAEMLNEGFVCIKVDREERPDIDHLYMTLCQRLTGSGGWPLTVIMTPDRKPFFAGTYFPDRARFGKPGMPDLIHHIRTLWTTRRDEITTLSDEIHRDLERPARDDISRLPEEETLIRLGYEDLTKRYDREMGGFSLAPKFPAPDQIRFLLLFHVRYQSPKALEMAEKTLKNMALGGIYDHIGFGFHRYATDAAWKVPHFEKMLYDQALLIRTYSEAYALTQNPLYKRVAAECIEYVLGHMKGSDGGFYTAEDADTEGVEGRYYLWTPAEIGAALGEKDAPRAVAYYHAGEVSTGPVGSDPSVPSVLFCDETALDGAIHEAMEPLRQRMLQFRTIRPHPWVDNTVLTDVNGLMITALAWAYILLGESRYLECAINSVLFIMSRAFDANGRLMHRIIKGEADVAGLAGDYACLISGLLALYQATCEEKFLKQAIFLESTCTHDFFDEKGGGFYLSASDAADITIRMKETYDGAVPSVNSLMYSNLEVLYHLTGRDEYRERAEMTASVLASPLLSSPAGCAHFLSCLCRKTRKQPEVTIWGRPGSRDADSLVRAVRSQWYLDSPIRVESSHSGPAHAVFCSPAGCSLPVTDPDAVKKELHERTFSG